MKRGFWDNLKKPIMALAPMANVTDAAFREMIARNGKPDVMWTEFVSVDGLLSAGPARHASDKGIKQGVAGGREKLLVDLWYGENERPIVAQIFGAKPENFYKVAQLIKELKFDGIDINMGCPEKAIQKQGSCAALIGEPKLAKEIIQATKEGGGLPVSVKTRIGLSKITLDEWLGALLEADLAAIILHLRTRKEMSKVPAHWELMPEIMRIRNQESARLAEDGESRRGIKGPLILGNGDVMTLAEAYQKVTETGCDGVMLGRGIFGNPWLFNRENPIDKVSIEDRMRAMLEHTKLFEQKFSPPAGGLKIGGKNFEIMKKHYKAYVNHFDGAKELRIKLMECENHTEVQKIVLQHFPNIKK